MLRNLDLVVPIDSVEIPGFDKWINWQGYSERHRGYDFICYLDKNNKCIFGLPAETKVRAIADGKVSQVFDGRNFESEYCNYMSIQHGKMTSVFEGPFSEYHHIMPLVEQNQLVKKGDVIATLYKDKGKSKGRIVHLHLELILNYSAKHLNGGTVDPVKVFLGLDNLTAIPQASTKFEIPELENQPEIVIANFRKLSYLY